MLNTIANNGEVKIYELEGTEKEIIGDLGATCLKTLLHLANDGSTSKEEVLLKYGKLARELVQFIDNTIEKIDDTLK